MLMLPAPRIAGLLPAPAMGLCVQTVGDVGAEAQYMAEDVVWELRALGLLPGAQAVVVCNPLAIDHERMRTALGCASFALADLHITRAGNVAVVAMRANKSVFIPTGDRTRKLRLS